MKYEILSIATIEEIKNLRKKYDKALEILLSYSVPCEKFYFVNKDIRFCHGLKKCETDDVTYKYCWDKYIEWSIDSLGGK